MSREIFVSADRILKLKNLLSESINISNIKEENYLDKKIRNFENYIKNNNLTKIGPFVIKTTMIGGNEAKLILTFLQQIKEQEFKPTTPYLITDEINSGISVYSRFEGHESNASIAQSKMHVYAYENHLILDTTSYSVYVSRDDDGNCVIDNFMVIMGKEK